MCDLCCLGPALGHLPFLPLGSRGGVSPTFSLCGSRGHVLSDAQADGFFGTHTCPYVLLVPLKAVILREVGFMHVISDFFILRVGLEPLPAFVSAVTAAWSVPYLFSFFF